MFSLHHIFILFSQKNPFGFSVRDQQKLKLEIEHSKLESSMRNVLHNGLREVNFPTIQTFCLFIFSKLPGDQSVTSERLRSALYKTAWL